MVAALLAVLAAPLLFPPTQDTAPPITHGMPWQIELPSPGASSVRPNTREAYFESVSIGPLSGKLVLTVAATPAELGAMRDKAAKTDHLETGIRKFVLNEADRQRAESMPLAGIVFIPAAPLDESIILQRFGTPAERIRQGETLEHFLYPDKGLDLVLDRKGREVLQYVAPAEFPRLRAPLGK